MIDLSLLRENCETIRSLILKKDPKFDISRLIILDEQVREMRSAVENLRKDRNEISKSASGGLSEELRNRSIEVGKELKIKEKLLEELEEEFKKLALTCPNILMEEVQEGGKENNKAVKTFSKKPSFDFEPKNHVELNKTLDWFDFDAATKIAGGNFVLYKKEAVKLIYALTQLMLKNNAKHGFEPVIPPYLATTKSLTNSSNLPKFAEDVYSVPADDLYLIPTAEVSLTNIHADSILNVEQLPLRYTAWTGCFRREAGGYGSLERGLIRIHQFEKVELYSIVHPQNSAAELDYMVECAENILQQLGLHYQVSLLAAQDCSFASAKTYDIEVWLPGQQKYYEVSSASNCTDFQARRAGIRFRESATAKPQLAHTLNTSSLALPRLMVALMETYQQEDGTIKFPKILQEMMDNLW
ncbi:TPA: serine--tRNA ligase [Candidatus Dependentiae bacterium]|nr:MAG: Serine-tRNA ligase [candidate division TM6 bacterium GW2011_GWE2_31_21]KKP53776.1 MAG: Serine-tRNA ligase [candidate division TM6 bacterium GW2011_GWF2_33_332]HBS48470.1 serine--tRNA ligase [Candidatus Dependentiae bacterium]HBZ73085.1 serine--tRNA ligase [Candidatus Dependentiae bacterium]